MDDLEGSLARLRAQIEQSEKVSKSSLRIGDIIYVPLDEDDGLTLTSRYHTRKKYIVIIGFTASGNIIGSLLINSKITPSKYSQEMLECQYPILVSNYPSILDYNSWLDCSEIFELSIEKIEKRNGLLKGCLIDEDRELVIKFIKETDIIDNFTKRKFGLI